MLLGGEGRHNVAGRAQRFVPIYVLLYHILRLKSSNICANIVESVFLFYFACSLLLICYNPASFGGYDGRRYTLIKFFTKGVAMWVESAIQYPLLRNDAKRGDEKDYKKC